jgi:very-short-patch-repair endonuclease
MLPRNKYLKYPARELRKDMTEAEKILWSKLRRKQLKGMQFYRQKVIGKYIVDFYCHQASLIVEVDGRQHYTQAGTESDESRDNYLNSLNLTVLRSTNSEVLKNIDGVVHKILEYL